MNLELLGWHKYSEHLESIKFEDIKEVAASHVARIISVHRSALLGWCGDGPINLHLPGKFFHKSEGDSDLPCTGDWIIMTPPFIDETDRPAAMVENLLPRKSKISRIRAGSSSDEQMIAANVDFAFIVSSANEDLNLKRIERFLISSKEGGVEPVILISKIDLLTDSSSTASASLKEDVLHLKKKFSDIKILEISTYTNEGVGELESLLTSGKTGVFIGSSGVGKSTLVNSLLIDDSQRDDHSNSSDEFTPPEKLQATKEIGFKDKGRHTTTSREIFLSRTGGVIIDTPGMREFQVFGDESSADSLFETISQLKGQCRFANCGHTNEPGCAINQALQNQLIDREDLQSYSKLQREMEYSNRKSQQKSKTNSKKRWKEINVMMRKKKSEAF